MKDKTLLEVLASKKAKSLTKMTEEESEELKKL